MKKHLLVLASVLFSVAFLSFSASAQNDDKVYARSEVDKQAVVERGQHPRTDGLCPRHTSGTIQFQIILRRDGAVEIVNSPQSSGCARFDENVYQTVKNLKFKPAEKDGQAVSVSMKLEYNYSSY